MGYEHSVMCCEHPRNGLRTFREMVTNTHEMGCEYSARRRGPIHRTRILTLLKTCICVTQLRVSTSLNMYIQA